MAFFDSLLKENKQNLIIAVCIIGLSFIIALGNYYLFSIGELLGFSFATSVIPGWHTTIYPPFFILGWIFLALAFLQLILILSLLLIKKITLINEKVIEYINIGLLFLGFFNSISYFIELFESWYSGYIYEQFTFYNQVFGAYWRGYLFMKLSSVVLPQLFWFKKIRRSLWATFLICLCLNLSSLVNKIVVNAEVTANENSYEFQLNYELMLFLIPIILLIGVIFRMLANSK